MAPEESVDGTPAVETKKSGSRRKPRAPRPIRKTARVRTMKHRLLAATTLEIINVAKFLRLPLFTVSAVVHAELHNAEAKAIENLMDKVLDFMRKDALLARENAEVTTNALLGKPTPATGLMELVGPPAPPAEVAR